LYYTASDIITPVGGCPVHRFSQRLVSGLLTVQYHFPSCSAR